MNAKFMEMVKEKALDLAEQERKSIADLYEGDPPGQKPLTDMEHRVWFEEMVSHDPLWALALPLVEGGMKELSRYERTVGLRGNGNG